jgi:hypothetical protein
VGWQSQTDLCAVCLVICLFLNLLISELRFMKGKRYMNFASPSGDHHYIVVDWAPKPKKSLSEEEAKRISKKEAIRLLFIVRE